MFRVLFLLFIAIPLIEIYLLIQVGGVLGAPLTIALVVLTAVLGAVLLRFQGLMTLQRVQRALAQGELPTVAMLEGAVLLVCGALLLTPGFFTDAVGFLGLIPPLRRYAVLAFLRRGMVRPRPPRGPGGQGPQTLEGEFRRED